MSAISMAQQLGQRLGQCMFKKAGVSVKGKTVLCTGGAGGMGALWARHFGLDGAKVVIWDLHPALNDTVAQLKSEGIEAYGYKVNVTSEESIDEALKAMAEAHLEIDILLNNAGIVAGGAFEQVPMAKSAAVLDVNLKGVMLVTHALLPKMIERNEGALLFVSSASGFIGVPYMAAYTASKWGVIGFAESLRLEMQDRHQNIHVAVFCPSYVDTGLFKGAKAPLLTPLLTPEQAVDEGYKAFRAGEHVICTPAMVKVTPKLKALLPESWFDMVSAVFGVNRSMKDWTGR